MSNQKTKTPYKVEKTPSMEDTLNSSIGSFFNTDEDVGDKLVKIILSLMNTGIDLGIDMTLGSNITEKTITELKNELLNKLGIIKELAKDPLIQEKVGEATKDIVALGLKTVEDVEAPLNEIIDRLLEMISETTNKTIRGSLETARGVAQSALAEVPILGGLIDIALTAGIAFNRFGDFIFTTTDNVLESTERIGTVVNSISDKAQQAYKTYSNTRDDIENRIKDVKNTVEKVNKTITEPIEKLQRLNAPSPSPLPLQSGGRKKKIDDLLTRISKRLASIN